MTISMPWTKITLNLLLVSGKPPFERNRERKKVF